MINGIISIKLNICIYLCVYIYNTNIYRGIYAMQKLYKYA